MNKLFFFSISLCLMIVQVAAQDLYVSAATGNNRNTGTKESPFKNLQKAIDAAANGATIYVAEGNYYGLLDKGNIDITKPVKIMGGYSSDFTSRDVLRYLTMIQPTPESNGSASGQGTMNISVKTPGTVVVIDGLIFDRGNSISYNTRGEGKPDGVECPMMNEIGMAGIGGPDLTTQNVLTKQTSTLFLANPMCDLVIHNCAFINSPYYGIIGGWGGKKAEITNNIFIGCRFAAVEIRGSMANAPGDVFFSYNTVLFTWSRLKDYGDMGYGYRYMPGAHHYVTNNIIGLSIFSGLDRGHSDSNKAVEASRITTAENNIFFLNKQADLTLPGGGMGLRVWVGDFEDVDQLNEAGGNKSLTDPIVFKGVINEPYLNGFLAASYKETTSVDPNSPANTFRQAMGMNMTGTMKSSSTMFANRYPWKEALKFFGAMSGYGAQSIQ